MSAPDVSAVIVAWNSGEALGACAASLGDAAQRAGLELQLIVVDNASADDAVDRLELTERDVRLRNPVNAGYGVAAAQGLARAEATWLLLVNPDLVVDSEFFVALAPRMRSGDPDVATLVPELRYAASRRTVNSRGVTVDASGIPAEIDLGEDVVEGLEARDVLGGSSGCCLLRRDAVEAVGGPEPVFFAYLEDVDLALRLQRAGYRALFVPGAIAWHEGSASTGEGSPVKSFLVARNRRIMFRLHGPRTIPAALWRLLADTGHAFASSRLGDLAAPWLGRLDALRLRQYTAYLSRARARHDARVARPPLTPRAGLRDSLRRKRAAARMTER
jgi:GT2 family glycosyltransferase